MNLHPLTRQRRAPSSAQKGVSLIEALVSLLVLALGILGMLGLQLKSMSDNQHAGNRAVAARLAADLFERAKSNGGGVGALSTYSLSSVWARPSGNPPVSCVTQICNPAQQAESDMWVWRQQVIASLPAGNATTFISPSDPEQLGVMVAWRLRATDSSPDAAANTQRAAWLNVNVPGGPTCPADRLCLVSYSKP